MGDEETRVICENALKILHGRIIINLKHKEKLKDNKERHSVFSQSSNQSDEKEKDCIDFLHPDPIADKTHSTSAS